MKTQRLILITILTFTLFTSFACGKKDKGKQAKGNEAAALAVKVGIVKQGDINESLNLVGNVLPKRKALIHSKVGGKVLKIYFRDGERMKKNEALIKIDPEDVDRGMKQARAALSTAYAAATLAQVQRTTIEADLNRLRELYDKGAISKDQLEKAEAGFKAAEANVKMAQAGIQQAQAAVGSANSFRRETLVRAPFDGEVAKLLLEEGERIQTMPPTPVMVLMDYDSVEVECQVTEREVGVIKEGMPVTMVLDAFPNSTIEATVTRVVPVLDPATRSFAMRIDLPNADHRIKPGMMARVKIGVVYTNIITVSLDASSLNNVTGQRRIVEVVDSKAVERFPALGRTFGNFVELTDLAGLQVGSRVIVSGASSIYTGMQVQVTATEGAP